MWDFCTLTNFYIIKLASKCLQTIVIMIALWLTYVLFIQPLLSPMRKVPGLAFNPLLGNVRFMLHGEATEAHMKLIKKYGPIVRFYFLLGRERLLVADPAAFRHIMVNNVKNYERPKNKLKLMYKLLRNGLLTSEGKVHAKQKRLMAPAFNHSSIESMIPIFQEKVESLAAFWKTLLTKSPIVPVQKDLQRMTLDIIGCTAFGYDFQSLNNPDFNLAKVFHQLITGIPISFFLFIPFYTSLPLKKFRTYAKNVEYVQNFVKNIIDRKKKLLEEDSPTKKDLLDMMMSSVDANTGDMMKDDELIDQVVTIMMAGHETTALGLTWTLLMLARNPEIQEKLRTEILNKFPTNIVTTSSNCFPDNPLSSTQSTNGFSDNKTETKLEKKFGNLKEVNINSKPENGLENNLPALTIEELDSLEYLDCVIKESLRLNPPVSSILRVCKNNDIINNYPVPAKTIVTLAVGAMMRKEDYFSEAEKFKPERFLQSSSSKKHKQMMEAYLPFIIGPRMCLGFKFALIEMKISLIHFLKNFKFELDPSFSDYKRKTGITMRPEPSVNLMLTLIQN